MKRLVTLGTLFVGLSAAALAQDSGFHVQTNGFGFRNYGNSDELTNLTPADLVRMFGPGVNATPDSGEVNLVPAAEEWMEEKNAAIGGGHCEGLAVLSYLFHLGESKPEDFGAESANALKLDENVKLQREVAYWWATQCTDTTRAARIAHTPKETVEILRAALPQKDPEKAYVVEFWMRDGTAGHAVTPYAVVDTDDTHSHIMIYDNNFPNQERFIQVDRGADTWSYSTAANPAASENAYEGDAGTRTLCLTPCAVRLKVQECAFLGIPPYSEDEGLEHPSDDKEKPGDETPDDPEDEAAPDDDGDGAGMMGTAPAASPSPAAAEEEHTTGAAPAASPSAAAPAHHHHKDSMHSTPSEKKYSAGNYTMDIALTGEGADLLIKDPKGHRLGFDNGKLVSEIPGAEVLRVTNAKAPGKREEPSFRVPGGVDYLVTLTGTAATPEAVRVSCLNRGAELVVEDITVAQGKTDTVYFSPDGTRVAYRPSGEEHPSLVAGYESKGPDYEITAHGVETSPGAMVELEIISKTGCAKVQVLDSKETASVEVEIERLAHDGASKYENHDLKLEPNDAAYFHFASWKGGDTAMSVDFDKGGDGKVDSVQQFANEKKKK